MKYSYIRAHDSVEFSADSVEMMPFPQRIFFVHPCYFNISYAINPHMLAKSGELNKIDSEKALHEWENLVGAYRSLGLDSYVMHPEASCPDMVFCANQTLPFINRSGQPAAILSKMHDPVRRDEVEKIGAQLELLKVTLDVSIAKQNDLTFEGMGDALWVPGRKLLLGGYGVRTSEQAYEIIAPLIDAHIVLFELTNPDFYHLDTCLSVLDDTHVLATRSGFTENGWNTLKQLFKQVIEVPLSEANSPGFACNAHSPDQKHVLIQRGNFETEAKLKLHGFIPIPLETEEFIKSGGSVFCMKQMFF